MKRFSIQQLIWTLAIAGAAWFIVALLCGLVGTTGTLTWNTFTQRLADSVLPASMVGAALAGAGVVYQAILRNPLADPYLLGVSSGAMLGSYLWHLPAVGSIVFLATLSPQMFAFAGALIATTIVLTCAGWRGRLDPVTAILVGAVVNTVFGATFMLLNTIYRDLSGVGGTISFLIGDLQTNVMTRHLWISFGVVVGGLLLMYALSSSLNVIRLSDEEARSIGVRVQRARWTGLILASLVTAAAVAVSGPIGFVGLIGPHLMRSIVGNDLRRLLPLSVAAGAILVAGADAIARYLAAENHLGTRLPVGVLLALVGGPAFIGIFLRSVRQR